MEGSCAELVIAGVPRLRKKSEASYLEVMEKRCPVHVDTSHTLGIKLDKLRLISAYWMSVCSQFYKFISQSSSVVVLELNILIVSLQVYTWISKESLPRTLLLRVWFMNQQHWYIGAYKKCRIWDPFPDLINQYPGGITVNFVKKLHFITKQFIYLFIHSFIFISWRLITLQYCSGFCHTLTRISHGFTGKSE